MWQPSTIITTVSTRFIMITSPFTDIPTADILVLISDLTSTGAGVGDLLTMHMVIMPIPDIIPTTDLTGGITDPTLDITIISMYT